MAGFHVSFMLNALGSPCLSTNALMSVRFANSYVDRLFAERDMAGLYHLVSVTSRERQLPEEFWLLYRIVEWVGSTRSGVWQYYESLSDETFRRMSRALRQFGLSDVADKYEFGHADWRGPEQAASLDAWIDKHEQQMYSGAFDLIPTKKDSLIHADLDRTRL